MCYGKSNKVSKIHNSYWLSVDSVSTSWNLLKTMPELHFGLQNFSLCLAEGYKLIVLLSLFFVKSTMVTIQLCPFHH